MPFQRPAVDVCNSLYQRKSLATEASIAKCRKLGAESDEAVQLAGKSWGEPAAIISAGLVFIEMLASIC